MRVHIHPVLLPMLSRADLSPTLCRSVRPSLGVAEELDIDWGAAYLFLFPDGNILHGSWTSYAIVALATAIVYELGMQILYLFMRVNSAILSSPECGQELSATLVIPRGSLAAPDIRNTKRHSPLWLVFQVPACHGKLVV